MKQFEKCSCGGWIFPFVNTTSLVEGRKCSKCGTIFDIRAIDLGPALDYEDLILARDEDDY